MDIIKKLEEIVEIGLRNAESPNSRTVSDPHWLAVALNAVIYLDYLRREHPQFVQSGEVK